MENKKHVFWQAFFVTLLFFMVGLVLGVYLEQLRSDDLSMAFYNSEVSLYDSFALGKLIDVNVTSCENLKKASVNFADKIYDEARELERFDEKSKLTESMKSIHRKYDLLRTLLWINVIDLKKKCPMNSIVYLYIYDTEDIEIKSKQVVWERILREVKEEKGSEVILIPIATDQGIESLDYLTENYKVDRFPAILINENQTLYEHKTSEEIGDYFN